jgi:hypothetical protein
MYITLYLPNKRGNPVETVVPMYIEEILFRRIKDKDVPRIHMIGPYRFRMYGYNPQRPAYGIHADIEKLNKWTSRYFCPLEDIEFHEERKNYHVEFTLYDPVAQQLEKHGLIRV